MSERDIQKLVADHAALRKDVSDSDIQDEARSGQGNSLITWLDICLS